MKIIWAVVILYLLCTFATISENAANVVAWIFLACTMAVLAGADSLLGGKFNEFAHFFKYMLILGLLMAGIQLVFEWPLGYHYADKVTVTANGGSHHVTDTGGVVYYDDHGNVVYSLSALSKPIGYQQPSYRRETRYEYHYTGSGKDAWDRQVEISGYQGDVPVTSVWVKVNGVLKHE